MTENVTESLTIPDNLADAVAILSRYGSDGIAIAGGTWVMRSPMRGEDTVRNFVSLQNIKELRHVEITVATLQIGAMTSHAEVANILADTPEFRGIQTAARKSANPSVRAMATIGGNICADGFTSPDLVPALLACNAKVHIRTENGDVEQPLEEFLTSSGSRGSSGIVTRVEILRGSFYTSHQRLLIRKAGEYPVANLSVKLSISDSKTINEIRIFVGSVEASPKRWASLENAAEGASLASENFKAMAQSNLAEFTGRDGPDAPGWYRTRVLPRLFCDAISEINEKRG